MARPLLLSNGRLHVGINKFGLVHDFYYPYVGGENHSAAQSLRHKVGVWIDGVFSWLDGGSWTLKFHYVEGTLVGFTSAHNKQLDILLEFTDAVDYSSDVFMRSVHVVNAASTERRIKLYFHQVFIISNSRAGDTCQYIPADTALLHYKGRRFFYVGGTGPDHAPFSQYAVGIYGIEGREGVYKDAEDGMLSGNAVEHGRVDSVLGFELEIKARDSVHVSYWITAGTSLEAAQQLHRGLLRESLSNHLLQTASSWHKWSKPIKSLSRHIRPAYREPLMQSALLIKSQLDSHGAVIASTDTTMLNYARDAYAYCWPRDGAYALWPMIRLGYTDEIMRYFDYCARIIHRDGYLMHKYQPDGALGSSWHPYQHGTTSAPPIQEDETAITVYLLAQYYQLHKDPEILVRYYDTLVRPMAQFMTEFVDSKTGLPLPTYDLWERLYLTTTYTTASVYGALLAAAGLAEAQHKLDDAVRWRSAAETMQASSDIFYDQSKGCFIKGFIDQNGSTTYDTTIDASSAYGPYLFGLFDVDSNEVRQSFSTVKDTLSVSNVHPGIARFENDEYNRADITQIGNPWYVTTLWMSQYAFETGDSKAAHTIISWVQSQMVSSGVLAEQFDAMSLEPISVAPLTWSQAEYINCVLDSAEKKYE